MIFGAHWQPGYPKRVAPHVIEKMLGHELGGVLSVYNKHDWIAEQKDAYDLYAEKIFWHIRKISG
jgi:hypothetical protein